MGCFEPYFIALLSGIFAVFEVRVRPRVPQRDTVRTLMEWFMTKEGVLFDMRMKRLGL